ncbi:MAG: centrosomin N-terminal motif 1-containing protein [Phycisphaerales bacterium JB065]
MRSIRIPLALLVLCLVALFSPSTMAQDSPRSISELRRENEQLRLRIDELEAQLTRSQEAIEKLLEQVSQLNERVAQLQRELERRPAGTGQDSGPADSPPPPVLAKLPEGEVFAAPEALLRFTRESYEASFGDIQLPFASPDARNRYLRDAESWLKGLKRTQRDQIDWTIEIVRVHEDQQPLTVDYRVVDPQSRTPYSGRIYTLQVPSRFERRFRDAGMSGFWQLRGVVGLAPNINREREDEGFFDVRPFIGPYIEFGIDLSVNSLLRATEPEQPEENQEAPGADADS